MQGLVITKNADLFSVECDDKIFTVKPSGKTKGKGIFVGDKVEFSDVITGVMPRRNLLIRPPVANIDRIFIVIAPIPKPDLVLVDKIIIYCVLNAIEPIIVLNKKDLASQEFIDKIDREYAHSYKIVKVSAKNGDVEELKEQITGLCVMAGQSAVGKSSIINAILGNDEKVGSLSKRTERGRQTTRLVKLFKINGEYLADTAGFSLLDLSMVSSLNERELASYYPEFLKGMENCKYRSCLHEGGGECGVIKMLENGEITQARYENYLKILQELRNGKRY